MKKNIIISMLLLYISFSYAQDNQLWIPASDFANCALVDAGGNPVNLEDSVLDIPRVSLNAGNSTLHIIHQNIPVADYHFVRNNGSLNKQNQTYYCLYDTGFPAISFQPTMDPKSALFASVTYTRSSGVYEEISINNPDMDISTSSDPILNYLPFTFEPFNTLPGPAFSGGMSNSLVIMQAAINGQPKIASTLLTHIGADAHDKAGNATTEQYQTTTLSSMNIHNLPEIPKLPMYNYSTHKEANKEYDISLKQGHIIGSWWSLNLQFIPLSTSNIINQGQLNININIPYSEMQSRSIDDSGGRAILPNRQSNQFDLKASNKKESAYYLYIGDSPSIDRKFIPISKITENFDKMPAFEKTILKLNFNCHSTLMANGRILLHVNGLDALSYTPNEARLATNHRSLSLSLQLVCMPKAGTNFHKMLKLTADLAMYSVSHLSS